MISIQDHRPQTVSQVNAAPVRDNLSGCRQMEGSQCQDGESNIFHDCVCSGNLADRSLG